MTMHKRLTAWTAAILLLAAASLPLCTTVAEAAAQTKQRTVFNYLTKTLELTPAAACGLMANAERESDFNPRATGDHGTSYGIFQWHATRFSALQNYCSSHGLDYRTMRGQLTYLGHEMQTEYASVYRYLKTLDNDAYSAYRAGFYWCYHYERPAGYLSASVSRGELARQKYWPRYGKPTVEKPAVKPRTPVLTGTSVSGSISEGRRIELAGRISSNVELTKVTAGFLLMNGNPAGTASVSPGENTYDLNQLAGEIHSESLEPGSYIFEVTAANAGGTEVLLRQTVTVLAKKDERKDENVQFLCVDNRNLALEVGEKGVQLTGNTSARSTHFQVVQAGNGWFSVRSLSTNQYLTAAADGRLLLSAWSGDDTQLWQFLKAAGTMMTLVPRSFAGRMVTVGGELAAGISVKMGDGALDKTQLFRIVSVQDAAAIVKPAVQDGSLEGAGSLKKMSLRSVTSPAKGQIRVTWKRDLTADGCEIQASASAKFPLSGRKTASAGSSRTQKCTLKNCRSGKTYYVRIRAFRKEGSGKTYGSWSRLLKVTVQ